MRAAARRCVRAVVLCCLILLIVGCDQTGASPKAQPNPTSTATPTSRTFVVQRGTVTRTLEFEGRIAPIDALPLYFRAPGYVKEVYVRQGQRIQEGELLATLETDDLKNQIAQAQVALDSAQLALAGEQRSLKHDIARAELDLEIAQTRLAQAEDLNTYAITRALQSLLSAQEQLSRILALRASFNAEVVSARVRVEQAQDLAQRAGAEYQESLERAWESNEVRDAYARELQQARWNLSIAQAQYDQAEANSAAHQQDIRIQQIAVQQADSELERLRQGVDPLLAFEVQRAQQDLERLQDGVDPALVNDVNRAELALERLQGQLANAQIVAPADGEVASCSIVPGLQVQAFDPVMLLAGASSIEVSAELSSDQIQEIALGQEVFVFLDADPDRIWTGRVRRLPYSYDTGAEGTEQSSANDNTVRISLEGDASGLQLRDRVRLSAVVEEKENVLWLPPEAIGTLQGRKFATVQENQRQRRVDVETGIASPNRVEITSGLDEGRVVLEP